MDAQNAVHTALCDSIDTATAIKVRVGQGRVSVVEK
jgi:hypothetical protein